MPQACRHCSAALPALLSAALILAPKYFSDMEKSLIASSLMLPQNQLQGPHLKMTASQLAASAQEEGDNSDLVPPALQIDFAKLRFELSAKALENPELETAASLEYPDPRQRDLRLSLALKAWLLRSPNEALDWMVRNASNTEEVETAVCYYIIGTDSANRPTERAWSLALEIEDAPLKMRALSHVLSEIADTSRQKALDALASLEPLSPENRAGLLSAMTPKAPPLLD